MDSNNSNINNINNSNSSNNSNNSNNNTNRSNNVNNVLGGSILAVIFTAIACVAFYFLTVDKNDFDSLLPVTGEKYTFDNTKVTSGNIKKTTDVSDVVEKVMPSVVAITETTIVDTYENFFGFYQGNKESVGNGSGIIIGQDDDNYYIVTNNHVIDGADKIRVGDTAIAIGNSLGYGQSVTLGYVGALNRKVQLENGTMEAIQTDAAINPGNSGGALLDLDGNVIGINSAKLASQEVEGMGYAIPISKAKPILDKLITKKIVSKDEKGYFGITGRTVSEDEIKVLSYKEGVFVVSVSDKGGAKEAGIKEGDIITKLNGEKITTIEGLISELESYKKGETVNVTVYRKNGDKLKKKSLKVTLSGKEVITEDTEDEEEFD